MVYSSTTVYAMGENEYGISSNLHFSLFEALTIAFEVLFCFVYQGFLFTPYHRQ